MKYLLAKGYWPEIKNKIKIAAKVLLFLDYDGTLTPIRKHPGLARLSANARRILRKLSVKEKMQICIISGRSLAEIRNLVGLKNIIYIGNHGLELNLDCKLQTIPDALKIENRIGKLCRGLKHFNKRFPGFWVENKGLTASLHYRLVPNPLLPELKSELETWLKLRAREFKITAGKKVLEIKPRVNRDKAWAVKYLRSRLRGKDSLTIYMGDDTTDQKALSYAASVKGLAIQIGKCNLYNHSFYYLKRPGETIIFLKRLERMSTRAIATI